MMFKIISIVAFLSFNTVLQAATILHPMLYQSRQDGGLISATLEGLSPNLNVKLYNMIPGGGQKLIGTGKANPQGFLQFPSVLILNRHANIFPGRTGHYVDLMAVDDTGRFMTAKIWLN